MPTITTAPKIRNASMADAAGIAECLASLGYGTSAELVIAKLKVIEGCARAAVFVSEIDTQIVGVISMHAMPLFHTQGELARITALAIREGWFRQGIGAGLIHAGEAWAWSVGAIRIEVTSGDHRDGAHRFYQASGYAVDERRFVKRVV